MFRRGRRRSVRARGMTKTRNSRQTLNYEDCLKPVVREELTDVYTINLSHQLNCLSTLRNPFPDVQFIVVYKNTGFIGPYINFPNFRLRDKNCQCLKLKFDVYKVRTCLTKRTKNVFRFNGIPSRLTLK